MASMEGNWKLVLQVAEKPMVIRGAKASKPSFVRDPKRGVLISNTCSVDKQLLEESRTLYTSIKLMRDLWTEAKAENCSTFFPLAAPAGAGVLWGGAGRCLLTNQQSDWRCGSSTEVLPSSPLTQPLPRVAVDLGWLRDGSELVEHIPSQPTQRISSANAMPDFSSMLADAPEQGLSQLFIPSARQLACGNPVCVLGFAGRTNAEWARTFIRTQAD